MAKDLNKVFQYPKIKPVKYRNKDVLKLRLHPVLTTDYWADSSFDSIKRLVRFIHYKTQKRRCAYCRRLLNPLGINEHLDHIVARSICYQWMFKPKNLVLTCYQCNTQKNKSNILETGWQRRRLPKKEHNYVYFNPYFHIWGDHFEIEDNLFIKAKTRIGEKTIKEYKLFDFKYSIKYADESNSFNKSAIRRANNRLKTYPKDSDEYQAAKKLIAEIERNI